MSFLFDLSLIGEAIELACRNNGLRRINYEVLGNSLDHLHGHVHPRYDWEPPERITGPVWRYPKDERNSDEFAYSDERHGAIRAAIADTQGTATRPKTWAREAQLLRGRHSHDRRALGSRSG